MPKKDGELNSTASRVIWGAAGGLLPFAIRLLQATELSTLSGLLLAKIIACIVLGAVASYAFRAHHVIAALYHGATAPIALAFVTGVKTH